MGKFAGLRRPGATALPPEFKWPGALDQIPDWIFNDPRIFALERERFFRGRSWNYVTLEVVR